MTAAGGPLGALEGSGLGRAMREWLWLYPGVEVVHIVGLGLLFGSIAVLDLRLLGFSRGISARCLAAHVLPWTAGSFLLIVPSGLLMFTAHATEFVQSDVFIIKMLLILAAGLNAALFHIVVFKGSQAWDTSAPPGAARAFAAASLLLWIAVIACGRLLAYF